MFKRILIANRGEIACRIMRTAKKMGIHAVAVYSTADENSLHVAQADSAVCIGPAPSKESYLNIEAIIAAAKATKAEAIHPGYGFLSENPAFAQACEDAGIVFIGPHPSALKAMGSKQLAKQLLENTSVPLTPGYHGADQDDRTLLKAAEKIGFPVLLKAANGGGGKGMRAIEKAADFQEALMSARREALASFGDQTMIIEKLITHPRHVEIQILADNHGNICHLFERDCSIQRRHQKIIEEAPAPDLPPDLRAGLTKAACNVAKAIDYRNAGTIEFLVDVHNQAFYFMEMNTRLQVEHPVTEMITGLDLVELQLKIAANEPLPFQQKDIQEKGHALECRIYAEDPAKDFLPSIGNIHFLKEPVGEGIRIDTGVQQSSTISRFYDPMIAKLVAYGENREQALQRMQQALAHYAIGGVKTNIPFLSAVCSNKAFQQAALSTHFLDEQTIHMEQPDPLQALWLAATWDYLQLIYKQTDPLLKDSFGFHTNLQSSWVWRYVINDTLRLATIFPVGDNTFNLVIDGQDYPLTARMDKEKIVVKSRLSSLQAFADITSSMLTFHTEKGALTVERYTFQNMQDLSLKKNQLTAPMPATVVAILKNPGETVKAGEGLIVLEAMKMEHTIHAPSDGILKTIFYDVGAQVNEGAELLTLDK